MRTCHNYSTYRTFRPAIIEAQWLIQPLTAISPESIGSAPWRKSGTDHNYHHPILTVLSENVVCPRFKRGTHPLGAAYRPPRRPFPGTAEITGAGCRKQLPGGAGHGRGADESTAGTFHYLPHRGRSAGGRKVFSLQTLPASDPQEALTETVGKVAGFTGGQGG